MFKKILALSVLVSSLLSNEVKISNEMNDIIKSLPTVASVELIEELKLSPSQNEDGKSKKEMMTKEFEKFKFAIEQITDENYKKLALDNYNEGLEKIQNNENITIFYFISGDSNHESIRSFMTYIDILNSHNSNIKGKILLNNYPDNFVDTYSDTLNTAVEETSKNTSKGSIIINENGDYTYKINNISGLKSGEKYQESISYNKKTGEQGLITLNLKADDNGQLKIVGKTVVDSMVPYLKKLKEKNIGSTNVKFHIHPWAFDSLKLKVVPAYLFSKCDSDNFKFRDCENEFIAKGNITLEYFIELISEKDTKYKALHNSLKEGMNVKN